MGVYASTDASVVCKSNGVARKVASILRKQSENSDENANDFARDVEVSGENVYFKASSGRYQNLQWQTEQIWEAIKDIDGVLELQAPFMVEDEGCYYTKDDE